CTQRRLLKNQREEFAAQGFGIARRIRLDVRRDCQQLARMCRAPFRSGEQIVGFLRWNCQGCRCHFHLETEATDLAAGDEDFASEASAAGTRRGAWDKTSSNKFKNSRTCALVIKNAGSSRIV